MRKFPHLKFWHGPKEDDVVITTATVGSHDFARERQKMAFYAKKAQNALEDASL